MMSMNNSTTNEKRKPPQFISQRDRFRVADWLRANVDADCRGGLPVDEDRSQLEPRDPRADALFVLNGTAGYDAD
jgi:hypothetical protein